MPPGRHQIVCEIPRPCFGCAQHELGRGGIAGRTKFGFFLECAELRIAITIRTLNDFTVPIANALNHRCINHDILFRG